MHDRTIIIIIVFMLQNDAGDLEKFSGKETLSRKFAKSFDQFRSNFARKGNSEVRL